MSKKLLEEATVRRFMKIAGLQPLSEGFVDKLEEKEELKEEEGEEEEKVEEAKDAEAEDKKPMEENLDEMYKEEDADPSDDMPAEMGGEEDEVSMGDSDEDSDMDEDPELEDALNVVLDRLGYKADMQDKDGKEEPDMDAPEALDESEHMEETPIDPAGDSLENPEMVDYADSKDPNQDPKEKEEEAMKDGGDHMAESKQFKDKLVEQVAKRVAARLKKMK